MPVVGRLVTTSFICPDVKDFKTITSIMNFYQTEQYLLQIEFITVKDFHLYDIYEFSSYLSIFIRLISFHQIDTFFSLMIFTTLIDFIHSGFGCAPPTVKFQLE